MTIKPSCLSGPIDYLVLLVVWSSCLFGPLVYLVFLSTVLFVRSRPTAFLLAASWLLLFCMSMASAASAQPLASGSSLSGSSANVQMKDPLVLGIGARILVPVASSSFVVGQMVAIVALRDGQLLKSQGFVSTVVQGRGVWVWFPSLNVTNGSYPPSPIPSDPELLLMSAI